MGQYGVLCFFFFKQKTAYEIKECDWSSDVCSSDLKIIILPFFSRKIIFKAKYVKLSVKMIIIFLTSPSADAVDRVGGFLARKPSRENWRIVFPVLTQ